MRTHARLRTAVAWSYALSGSRIVVTSAVTFVLAALLGPESFGTVAMALVLVGFCELLLQQGLLPALISRKELRPEHADTAFWCVMGVACVLTGVLIGSAPWWARANSLPQLTLLVWALSPVVLLQASVVVHEALLRRSLQFAALTKRVGAAAVAGGAAGTGAAVLGAGTWALVVQQLVTAVVGVAVLWRVSSWRPRRRFEPRAARELYAYALHSSSASTALYLGNRADVLLAGLFFGPVVVGLYRLAHRLGSMVLEIGSRAMQGVALPGLSLLRADPQALGERWMRMQRLSLLLSLPALAALAGAAGDIPAVLGPEWAGAVPAVRLLVLAQAAGALSMLSGPVLQALGRPGLLSALTWGRTAGLIGGLVVVGVRMRDAGTEHQLLGLLAVTVLVAVGGGGAALVVAAREAGLGSRALLRACFPGLTAGVLAWLVTQSLYALGQGLPVGLRLVLVGLLTAGLTALALVVVEPQVRRRVRRSAARPTRAGVVLTAGR